MDYPELSLFIDGQWRGVEGRDTIPVVNPATGTVVGQLPVASTADLDDALESADAAFLTWRDTPAFDRYQILRRAAELLRERAAVIGRATTIEQGKPVGEATAEAFAAADIFDWFAEEGRRTYGRIVPTRVRGVRDIVLKQPVGPVAGFTPWNFPITIPARKVAAALAAGCTVILKPAEETPATGLALAHALADAGLPAGVFNVVFGDPATISEHLIHAPQIRKVTFTGSTAVGKLIGHLAADGIKKATLELGGHAPVLVFNDAEIEKVAAMAVKSKFRNAGQICIAPTRFLVQQDVHDRFVTAFSAAIGELRIGNGLDPETTLGPLAHARRGASVGALVDDAVARGARTVTGGSSVDGPGFFWKPTLLTELDPASRILHEEPFGPVALVVPFSTVDEALERANEVSYGLASYAFTSSLRTAHEVSERIEAGMLAINHFRLTGPETPFGGVKESGYGSEGGSEGIEGYLHTRFVSEG